MTKKTDLDSMSVDEMWQLHEEIGRALSVRLASEKRELEKRLARLRSEKVTGDNGAPRIHRKYPQVLPKYRNPNEPYETWSGRGKLPRWLAAALKTGRKVEDFAISKPESSKNNGRRRRA
jgi:DNA-binding protein H-NS